MLAMYRLTSAMLSSSVGLKGRVVPRMQPDTPCGLGHTADAMFRHP